MESLKTSFLSPILLPPPSIRTTRSPLKYKNAEIFIIRLSVTPDPWSLSDGNPARPKPRSKNAKRPLSDDNARRIIKAKAQYLSVLRRNQGPRAQTPKWIKRTPEQMVQYLEDDRNGHLYGKHVVAAIRHVRSLSQKTEGEYDMRMEMASFVEKLTFREMCIVLKEQKGWRQVRDVFDWMKLQLSYRPSVIVYTIVLRAYGQVGKIKLAEETFLEMLEVGLEPDEVACGTMLCTYARWGHHKAMLSFYSAVKDRGIIPPIAVFNFMLSSLQKKGLHAKVKELWMQMVEIGVTFNDFTYTVVINSLVKEGHSEEAFEVFNEMKNCGFVPEEVTYNLLISLSIKRGNSDEVLRLYKDMRDKDIVPSNYTCSSLLTLFYKNGDYPKALSLFSEMESKKVVVDEVIYGLLIRIYGKLGLYEDAHKTFEEMEQLGLLTDEKSYLAMAQVHLNSRNFEKALDIIELMKSRNIWLSRFAYIVSLQCYVMKEDIRSTESTFQALSKTGLPDAQFIAHIRKDGVVFDEELYKLVMRVYCKEGLSKDAEILIELMKKDELFVDNKFMETFSFMFKLDGGEKNESTIVGYDQPDHIALDMILRLYLANGDVSKRSKILKFILGKGGVTVVSQLVANLIREGKKITHFFCDSLKAGTLTKELLKLDCRLDDATIASLISLFGKEKKINQAAEILAAVAVSCKSTLIFGSMIDAYIKCDKAEEAFTLYKELIGKGYDLGAVAVSRIVNTLTVGAQTVFLNIRRLKKKEKLRLELSVRLNADWLGGIDSSSQPIPSSGKHRVAENVIRASLNCGLELDTVAFNTFIKAMLEGGKLHFASRIYEHMIALGVVPSIQTYNTMISVYGRGRKLDKAVEMFNAARSSGLSPDEKAYTNLISYYGKAGKTHEASLLFKEMLEEGVKPGMVSYNIMVNVYANAGLHEETENLFKVMEQDSVLPDSFTYFSLIRAYTQSGKYSEAEKVINSMQEKGIPTSCAHYDLLLSALAKAGMIRKAERVYDELQTAGLSPDVTCNRTLMRGYLDYGYVREGIEFFESTCKYAGDRFIMSAAVHFYKAEGKEDEALNILDSMKTLGISFLKDLQIGLKLESA
ncbi:pentatricopeptide repeat-containing protein [Cucumis melo var. makuwa]|uniref:Pentatricopeptide repeat-containing protein n=1 Tax=Cucumis melo var. makuwa TaxID=1194695 RepID=A0A5A7THY4_CUCMM|nr:pentatricopeptide repeat-containing protein [Cucumis melo var. makuwa]